MFERFTDLARRAIVLAQEESRSRRHREIDVGHLVLGTLEADRISGLDAEQAAALRRMAEEGLTQQRRRRRGRAGHIPFTPGVDAALERAVRVAADMNRPAVTPADLLLAALEQPPLAETIAREGFTLPPLGGRVSTEPAQPTTDSGGPNDRSERILVLLEQILRRLDTIADELRGRGR